MSYYEEKEDYDNAKLTEESEIRREEYEIAIAEMGEVVDGDNDRIWVKPVPKLSTVFANWTDDYNRGEQI